MPGKEQSQSRLFLLNQSKTNIFTVVSYLWYTATQRKDNKLQFSENEGLLSVNIFTREIKEMENGYTVC